MRSFCALFSLGALALLAAACGGEFAANGTTPGGVHYEVVRQGSGEKLQPGDVLKVDYTITVPSRGDTELYSTYRNGVSAYYRLGDTLSPVAFEEAWQHFHTGDSAVMTVRAADIYGDRGLKQRMPPYITDKDELRMRLHVLAVFNPTREFATYLDSAHVPAPPKGQGVAVQVLRPGNGPQPKPGQKVVVNYVARMLNGTIFDRTPPNIPLVAPLGSHLLSAGMEQGLQQMHIGERARVVVPATLAFPGRSPYPTLRPYSNVVLELELLEIR